MNTKFVWLAVVLSVAISLALVLADGPWPELH
jgi:hypothetical protein